MSANHSVENDEFWSKTVVEMVYSKQPEEEHGRVDGIRNSSETEGYAVES